MFLIAVINLLMLDEVLILMIQVAVIILILGRNSRRGVIIIFANINWLLIVIIANSLSLILASVMWLWSWWKHPWFMSALIIPLWVFLETALILIDIVLVHSLLIIVNFYIVCLCWTLRPLWNFRTIISWRT